MNLAKQALEKYFEIFGINPLTFGGSELVDYFLIRIPEGKGRVCSLFVGEDTA